MFDEFRIQMFSLKKNVLCKKVFHVPLIMVLMVLGRFFSPPSSPSSLGSPISLALPVLPALPTLLDLPFFQDFGLSALFQHFDDKIGRAQRAQSLGRMGDLRDLEELEELGEPKKLEIRESWESSES